MKKASSKLVMFTAKTYREPSGDKPCNDCPFRRKSMPGWLGEATPQSFIVEISHENPLPCHPSIDYDDRDWLEKWGRQEIGKICAGSLIMAANMCKRPRDPNFPRLPSDRELVFSNHLEFIKHHEDAAVRSWESVDSYEKRSPVAKSKKEEIRDAVRAAMADRNEYVDAVRDALDDADKLSREHYIDALEELTGEIEARLDAARSDLASAQTGRRKGR